VTVSLPQLARRLDLGQWQVERAIRDGLLPEPDRARRCYSVAAAAALEADAGTIRAGVSHVPDMGAWKAAKYLAAKLGVTVTPGGIETLAAWSILRVTGNYKGFLLYDGGLLGALGSAAMARAAEAARDLPAKDAAAYMGIRESDFRLLARFGFIKAARWVDGQWARFALYAPAELDRFLARDDIDWAAVRATKRNKRSPLYYLAEPELVLEALAGTRGVPW
jgi:hypothetical protein